MFQITIIYIGKIEEPFCAESRGDCNQNNSENGGQNAGDENSVSESAVV